MHCPTRWSLPKTVLYQAELHPDAIADIGRDTDAAVTVAKAAKGVEMVFSVACGLGRELRWGIEHGDGVGDELGEVFTRHREVIRWKAIYVSDLFTDRL
jgi:hypothetical protein